MRAAGSGAIVNIASICSIWSHEGSGPYAVSKAGVVSLTKGLALELAAFGVRVNAVGPGYIEAPMTQAPRACPRGGVPVRRLRAAWCGVLCRSRAGELANCRARQTQAGVGAVRRGVATAAGGCGVRPGSCG